MICEDRLILIEHFVHVYHITSEYNKSSLERKKLKNFKMNRLALVND